MSINGMIGMMREPMDSAQIVRNYIEPLYCMIACFSAKKKFAKAPFLLSVLLCYTTNIVEPINTYINPLNIFQLEQLLHYAHGEISAMGALILGMICQNRIIHAPTDRPTQLYSLIAAAMLMYLLHGGHISEPGQLLIQMIILALTRTRELRKHSVEIELRVINSIFCMPVIVVLFFKYKNYLNIFIASLICITTGISSLEIKDAELDENMEAIERLTDNDEEVESSFAILAKKTIFLTDRLAFFSFILHGYAQLFKLSKCVSIALLLGYAGTECLIARKTFKAATESVQQYFGIAVLIAFYVKEHEQKAKLVSFFSSMILLAYFIKIILNEVHLVADDQEMIILNDEENRRFSITVLLIFSLLILWTSIMQSKVGIGVFYLLVVIMFTLQIKSEISVNGVESLCSLFDLRECCELIKEKNYESENGVYHCLINAAKSDNRFYFELFEDEIPIQQNNQYETVSHAASEFGAKDVLSFLFDKNIYEEQKDLLYQSKTPLQTAASYSTPRINEMIVERLQPAFGEYTNTPLHYAAIHGNYRLFQMYKQYDSILDQNGLTAQQEAAKHGVVLAVMLLKRQENIKDSFGRSTREMALLYKRHLISLIAKKGTKDLFGRTDGWYSELTTEDCFNDGDLDIFGRKIIPSSKYFQFGIRNHTWERVTIK